MAQNSSQFGVVLVTAASQAEAEKIAQELVKAKLAACVSITSINSVYTWQGKINCDREWQLTIKTNLTRFEELADKIKALHSYDVPEIIALPIIAGSESYLGWLAQNVEPKS